VETFLPPKDFVDNPRYQEQRKKSQQSLALSTIDPPIVDIVVGFSKLDHCFTLQSCYGHFLYSGQSYRHNIEPLPDVEVIRTLEYRIAYLALCIDETKLGRELFDDLRAVSLVNPEYIQFGSAEWFWERQVNSYAIQVEPKRHMTKDSIFVGYQEALHIERVRNQFFTELRKLLQKRPLGNLSG
jgi:hypothetical protein